ncbi:MAG TPA: FAD/NAD(P)-binding oxidoreductase [Verrucomicrobiae bacterium]|nr:FAD/NAD(P)-binding oxidoreductase [Verrucomicrobiae bacterium]
MREFDIVVIGAGPAGLAAASVAAESGSAVALVDDTPWLGGQIWRGEHTRKSVPLARRWVERFRQSGATLLDQASVVAAPGPGVLQAERPQGTVAVRWKKLILATGARELFLPFPGWTLPGVFGPGGLQALVKNGWPIAEKRVVIAGSGPLLLAVADGLKKAGARIPIVAEQAPMSNVLGFASELVKHPSKLLQGAGIRSRTIDVPYRFNTWVTKAEGTAAVESVTLTDGRRTWTEACDALACAFGLVPNLELPVLVGCELEGGFVRVNEFQQTSIPSIYCAGEITGIAGADAALISGQIAGHAAAGRESQAARLAREQPRWRAFQRALEKAFALRAEVTQLAADDTLLCRCEDVAIGRARQFKSWRDAKLQTRCGMGACQGRICGTAAKYVLGWQADSVRPPVLPARVESLIENQI